MRTHLNAISKSEGVQTKDACTKRVFNKSVTDGRTGTTSYTGVGTLLKTFVLSLVERHRFCGFQRGRCNRKQRIENQKKEEQEGEKIENDLV